MKLLTALSLLGFLYASSLGVDLGLEPLHTQDEIDLAYELGDETGDYTIIDEAE